MGERQTEVHFMSLQAFCAVSGGTVFDPQKLHFLLESFGGNWDLGFSGLGKMTAELENGTWTTFCPDGQDSFWRTKMYMDVLPFCLDYQGQTSSRGFSQIR